MSRSALSTARRIVVKMGTHVVTDPAVGGIALGRLHGLIEAVAALWREERQVVLVSSGAVAMGRVALGLPRRPISLGVRQACAAVGQGQLIALYTQAFGLMGVKVAQVLLTQEDLIDRDRLLCLRTTLMRLLELRVVPVLNENDSVSVRELIEHRAASGQEAGRVGFGDNDGLSARVAVAVDADLLVLLTDVDGVYTANPRLDPGATRIPEIDAVDDATLGLAEGTSAGGTGGMASKLAAAQAAGRSGIPTLVARGEGGVLARALAGEDVGTLVHGEARRSSHRRHIAVEAAAKGALVANDGAIAALRERKASLLPIGVTGVVGGFRRGEVVEIRDGSGRVFGRGLVNYDASECKALCGRHSSEIAGILGWQGYDEVITRDNLVLGDV
ncbi:MAG TPA: glutamate 5-kinase [Nannocystaceae bacterium]|nr:glutamate 5-kinase [Nannocystaceae bacterium]